MPYGTIKVDTITFTDAGVDKSVAISGLVQNPTFTGNVTATGTISGLIVQAPTVTGTTANFASGVYTTQISGAIVKVPAGSAGAPSIQVGVGASVAPGLYGAGTDLLGISTGGAGRIFIDSTGRLGVGTSSPVAGYATTTVGSSAWITNGANFTVEPDAASGANGVDLKVSFSAGGNGPLKFWTAGAERLRIDTSGRLLVGTSTAFGSGANDSNYSLIQIRGNTAGGGSEGRLTLGNTTASASIVAGNDLGSIWFADGSGGDYARILAEADGAGGSSDYPGRLVFSTTADGAATPTERLRIDSAGRVGIGTSSPWAPGVLDCFGNAKFGASSTNGLYVGITSGTPYIQGYDTTTPSSSVLVFYGGSLEAMRIDSSGRVGIGTSSPSIVYRTTINGNGSSVVGGLSLQNNGTETLTIGNVTAANNVDSEIWNPRNGYLRFATNNTERLRIDSSGNVLVGTSTARALGPVTARLQVEGTTFDTSSISLTNNSNDIQPAYLTFGKSRSGSIGGTTIVQSGDILGLLAFTGSDGTISQRAVDIRAEVDGTPGTNDMPGRLVFSTTADGAATPTERLRIDSAGRVGIGTTSLAAKLTVFGDGTSADTLDVLNPSATNGATIRFADVNSSSAIKTIPASGTHSLGFFVANATVERMRIDSSGRLLVGTSSSRQVNASIAALQFQIESTTYNASSMSLVTNQNATDGSYIVLGKSRGASLNSSTIVNSGDRLGAFWFCGADGTDLKLGASIEAIVDGTPGANDMPGRLVFSTTADGASTPTEKMRITKEGYVLIGATSFASAGTSFSTLGGQISYNNNSTDTGVSLWLLSARAADTGRQFLYFQADAAGTPTLVFQVFNNGNTQNANNSYTSISDSRLKENIVDSNSQWNDIKAIKIRNWNFKAETGLETHRQIGPVAQELELVCPGLVFETFDRDSDGNNLETATKGVNQSVLYMKAVKALQEAMERIETLEAKVAALEGN